MAVQLHEALLRQGYLHAADEGLAVTQAGAEWFAHQGINAALVARQRRMLAPAAGEAASNDTVPRTARRAQAGA